MSDRSPLLLHLLALAVLAAWPRACRAMEPSLEFFERRIRPLLIEHCLDCHGGADPQGGLSLEHQPGWVERGVIMPGSPDDSLLIQAVRYTNDDVQMPPPDQGGKLSDQAIRDLEQWVREGAIDPRRPEGAAPTGPRRRPRTFAITAEDLNYWAFQPLRSTAVVGRDGEDTLNEAPRPASGLHAVDQYLDARLEALGLRRNPPASPRELVRRAYFDLWGLPPDPAEVDRFQRDPSDAAWRRLIDRLLDSHHYGERWGRFWLDWVRYAETNGYERDGPKPNAWRYRDYVIRAFNSDKPYDRFLHEQLAGDLLIDHEALTATTTPEAWRDAVVATGFYRLHVWDDEPDDTEQAELDDLDDILITVGATTLGLTIGCARCHDHKFDPVSQQDYYALLDLLRDIDPYGLSKKGGGGRGTGQIERWLVDSEQLVEWERRRAEQRQELASRLSRVEGEAASELGRARASRSLRAPFPAAGSPSARGWSQADLSASPRRSTCARTQVTANAAGVSDARRCPSRDRYDPKPAGLRPLVDGNSGPLTASVVVTRLWQRHFGMGLVATPDDFGQTGLPSANPELLDWLAAELIRQGWSLKALHRTIMHSQAYRMSSAVAAAAPAEFAGPPPTGHPDPDNLLFWRQNLRRLDAEAIRDALLSYGGALHAMREGPSVYSDLSDEMRQTANPVSLENWGSSPHDQQDCRSVFLVVKRSLKHPLLEAFDFANSHSPVGQRVVTTVAPQALMMLNDQFVHRQASRLADRVIASTDSDPERIQGLWRIVYQRLPEPDELSLAEGCLRSTDSERVAWESLCRVLLNSSELIYVD